VEQQTDILEVLGAHLYLLPFPVPHTAGLNAYVSPRFPEIPDLFLDHSHVFVFNLEGEHVFIRPFARRAFL
jgi:hypothetical protein